MKNLLCEVKDADQFAHQLILGFINQTNGLSLSDNAKDPVDILFIDDSISEIDSFLSDSFETETIVISSNNNFIHHLFKGKITDYLYKPNLTYTRFLESIRKVEASILHKERKSNL